ncbi:sensor histidine kinase [Hahella ganghwensis]|uniref:sensor histidine kinase n=1 Tax=Hahella ganghwensis TaxID=286420 RepID=UPI000366C235|nr:ATP-binding protein [Hahella ganghwensis]
MATIPAFTTSKLFRVYNHYRVTVGIILLASLYLQSDASISQTFAPYYFKIAAFSYAAVHVFTAFLLLAGIQPAVRHIVFSIFLEVGLVTAMMLFGTGISGGLGNMLVISVAASNIMLRSQLGLLIAAIASLFVMGQEIYLLLNASSNIDSVFRAGVLGVVYFATALLVRNLSHRISASEDLARRRAQNIEELERLNHQIIQRMLTGIIVTNEFGQVRMANQAAMSLLGLEASEDIDLLPEDLMERLRDWQLDPGRKSPPFRGSSNRAPIQANFAMLQKEEGQDILIFLEDTGKIAQQAQQLKLASLGRLTAGIAHEIRNPLGAASHAAQLLLESEDLNQPDRQMTEIILRHAKRMNGIIENVLELSRGKSSTPEMIDLNEWLKSYINDYTAGGAISADIEIRLEKQGVHGRFDASHLHQILNNLIANGLRYSSAQTGYPWVGIVVGEIDDSHQAFLDILDNGPGIDNDQMPHLFEPFYTTDKKGTGLGLYLSKELCEANQAQLDCFKRDEGGSRFRITFPHPKRTT